jgi:hypothetical protein
MANKQAIERLWYQGLIVLLPVLFASQFYGMKAVWVCLGLIAAWFALGLGWLIVMYSAYSWLDLVAVLSIYTLLPVILKRYAGENAADFPLGRGIDNLFFTMLGTYIGCRTRSAVATAGSIVRTGTFLIGAVTPIWLMLVPGGLMLATTPDYYSIGVGIFSVAAAMLMLVLALFLRATKRNISILKDAGSQ